MSDAMLGNIVVGILLALLTIVFLAATVLLARWATRDARKRHKSPLFVVIAVVLFVPWGLIARLCFRPALVPPLPLLRQTR